MEHVNTFAYVYMFSCIYLARTCCNLLNQPNIYFVNLQCSKKIERKPNSKEDGDESETIPVSGRKRQFRWNSERDLTMVTEIEKVQPFSDSPKESVKLWSAVAETLNTTAPLTT